MMDSPINAVRILVAESDPDQMDYIAGILESAGYVVHKAYVAGDAVFALEHSDFALALIDTRMTDHAQQALTDYMARQHAIQWIVVIRRGDPVPQHLLDQGAEACVQSPFTSLTLLRYVEQALNGQAKTRVEDAVSARTPVVHAGVVVSEDMSQALKRQLIEQQTLSQLARSLSAVLDLDVLLTQVVDAAVRLCNAEEGLLLLPDEEEEALYIRAVKGLDSETARNFRIRTQDTVAGQVYYSGQPVLMGSQGPHKLTTQHLVKSLLYVPLSIKGQTIGVLGVNNRHADRAFTPHNRELLQDLAAHAAVAIENARLYEESVLRTRELSTLVQAAEATNSTLALDQVLSIIASQLIGALDMTQCYITEWYPEEEALRPLAIRYRALWKPTDGPVLVPHDYPAVEQLLSTRQPVLTAPESPIDDHVLAVWLPHHYHAHSVLHMPLYARDRLLGIATFYRMHAPYPAAVVPQVATTMLHRLTLQMVVLLVGAEATRRREDLFQIAQQMLDMAEADWVDIALWNSAQRQFDVTLSYGEMIWQGPTGPRLDVQQFPELDEMLHGAGALTDQEREELAQLCAMGYGRSLLTLPLEIKGEVAGLVFLVDTMQERQFTRREIELAQALVSQAANTLDNARLYRDLELSLDELHRTQSKLVQTARLSAMGELAAAVAHQINNPLTTILGDAELMLHDVPPDD
ncbi:MAG: GAF domain-containing protein, partial [Anaerolineae bacterium]|nr:GAF domain-containing protein [Anaerolineae bacterium]